MTAVTSLLFSGLTSIETLELSNNQLTTLPASGFADLSAVLTLGKFEYYANRLSEDWQLLLMNAWHLF